MTTAAQSIPPRFADQCLVNSLIRKYPFVDKTLGQLETLNGAFGFSPGQAQPVGGRMNQGVSQLNYLLEEPLQIIARWYADFLQNVPEERPRSSTCIQSTLSGELS
jgi:hypothetical protein